VTGHIRRKKSKSRLGLVMFNAVGRVRWRGMAVTLAVFEDLVRDGRGAARVVEDKSRRRDSPVKSVYFIAV